MLNSHEHLHLIIVEISRYELDFEKPEEEAEAASREEIEFHKEWGDFVGKAFSAYLFQKTKHGMGGTEKWDVYNIALVPYYCFF